MKRMQLIFLAWIVAGHMAYSGEFKVERDVPYLGEVRAEKMDAYIPSGEFKRPLPAVLVIHGGAWIKGDKGDPRERNICGTLARNGYAAFSINYQLGKNQADPDEMVQATRPDVPWPQNLYDCKSALRFLRLHADRFGIDPSRIAVWGGSAGGHLALLTALTSKISELNSRGLYTEQDNHVSCVLDFYGPPEILGERRIKVFSGSTDEETKANLKAAAATTYLDSDTPPVLIVHGTADTVVSIGQSEALAKALEAQDIPFQFIKVPDAGHAFHFEPKEMDLRPVVLDFLAKTIGRAELSTTSAP